MKKIVMPVLLLCGIIGGSWAADHSGKKSPPERKMENLIKNLHRNNKMTEQDKRAVGIAVGIAHANGMRLNPEAILKTQRFAVSRSLHEQGRVPMLGANVPLSNNFDDQDEDQENNASAGNVVKKAQPAVYNHK
jgi:hypothetical protein